jgi:ABC-2 type transport system ATP-binding protein
VLVRREGKTVLLATHNLREAEELCARVGMLVRARLRRVGSVEELRRWAGGADTYRLQAEGIEARNLPAGSRVLESGPPLRFEVTPAPGDGLDPILRRVHAAGGRVRDCEKVEATLEEVFSRVCAESGD